MTHFGRLGLNFRGSVPKRQRVSTTKRLRGGVMDLLNTRPACSATGYNCSRPKPYYGRGVGRPSSAQSGVQREPRLQSSKTGRGPKGVPAAPAQPSPEPLPALEAAPHQQSHPAQREEHEAQQPQPPVKGGPQPATAPRSRGRGRRCLVIAAPSPLVGTNQGFSAHPLVQAPKSTETPDPSTLGGGGAGAS